MNQVQLRESVVKRRRVEGGYLVVVGLWLMQGVLQLECARVLHKTLLVPVLMYGSETMKEEGYRVRAV